MNMFSELFRCVQVNIPPWCGRFARMPHIPPLTQRAQDDTDMSVAELVRPHLPLSTEERRPNERTTNRGKADADAR